MDGEGSTDAASALESAKAATSASRKADDGRWRTRIVMFSAIFISLGGPAAIGALMWSTDDSPFVYSHMVDEVTEHPAQFEGRTLRVEGLLQNGSIRFREDPCEWRFVLEREGQTMPVEFAQCVVPDTFRDGMGITVVVEGRLRDDGSFVASQVIPRCPSRYEMEQRQQAGESMPHPVPPAS
jgi:cytochrome c-type biogenesis protein CcmE